MHNESQFLKKLKTQTNEIHHKAHTLGYFKTMMGGEVSIKSYLTQLHTLAIVLSTLEREIQKLHFSYPELLVDGYLSKLPFLVEDIHYISSKTDDKVLVEVIHIALELANSIMLTSAKDPLLLLGYLYTLEGSLQGGEVLKSFVQKQFDLDNNKGVSYFNCYGAESKKIWNAFKESFEKIIVKNNKEDAIIAISLETFEYLIRIYSIIDKVDDSKLAFHSAALNPEAGELQITQDKTLIEIAKKSNEICWYQFPYFEYRFKERGYRFGLSSNAWSLTLLNMEYSLALSQALWLTKVLAGRGMPSLLLQKQYLIIDAELTKNKEITNNQNFAKIAEHIHQQREDILSDELADSLAKKFESSSNKECNRKLRNCGSLIVCSVIDEKLGYTNAIESLKSFLCDTNIFTSEWIEDVENFYTELENLI